MNDSLQLTPIQLQILVILARLHPDRAACNAHRVRKTAEEAGTMISSIYNVMGRLEKRGLLDSEKIDGDVYGRRSYTITPEGRSAVESVLADCRRMVSSCTEILARIA